MVVGLAEGPHSTSQCDLHVWWLHTTMREVGSELQIAFQVVGILLRHSTPLKFNGNAEGIFPGQGDGLSPLLHISN